mmetsp:Transcript_35587/g.83166  ORF Transcript_35587/g.83166 Transcript_35587/m.83166 type:complete len:1280 (+) Transcript_35587:60-3899(+)
MDIALRGLAEQLQLWIPPLSLAAVASYPFLLLAWMAYEGSRSDRSRTEDEQQRRKQSSQNDSASAMEGSCEECRAISSCPPVELVEGHRHRWQMRWPQLQFGVCFSLLLLLSCFLIPWSDWLGMTAALSADSVGATRHLRIGLQSEGDVDDTMGMLDGLDVASLRTAFEEMESDNLQGEESAGELLREASEPEGLLAEWLYHLQLKIPAQVISHGLFVVTLKGGTCRHLGIEGIDLVPMSQLGVHIKAHGLFVNCTLGWAVKGPLVDVGGYVDAQVVDSEIDGPLEVVSDGGQPPLPVAVHAKQCSGSFTIADLQFRGGSVSTILSFLAPLIQSILDSSLQTIICNGVDKAVNTQASAALASASKKLRVALETPLPNITPPKLNGTDLKLVNFAANPGMQMLQKLFSKVLDNPKSPRNIRIISEKFLGQNGSLTMLTLPFSKVLSIASYGAVNVTFLGLEVQGLNSTTNLALNAPSPQQLAAEVAVEELAVNLTVRLEVTPSRAGPLEGKTLVESFHVLLGVNKLSAGADFFVALNLVEQEKLSADQLLCMGCLLRSLTSAVDLANYLKVGSLQFELLPLANDGLERDVDGMINAVAKLLLEQFSTTVPVLLNYLVAGTARESLNKRIQHGLASPPPCKDPDPTYTSASLSTTMWAASLGLVGVAAVSFIAVQQIFSKHRRCVSAASAVQSTSAFHTLPAPENSVRVVFLQQDDVCTEAAAAAEAACSVRQEAASRVATASTALADESAGDSSGSSAGRTSSGLSLLSSHPDAMRDSIGTSAAARPAQTLATVESVRSEPECLETNGLGTEESLSACAPAPPEGPESSRIPGWDCLALHPRIPLGVSVALPVLLLATIFIFISSNSGDGVSIMLSVVADGGDVVELPPVKDFSLVSSVVEMWNAGVYPLGVLIVLFSGVWPYSKLIAMMFCWFAPSQILPARIRQKMLFILDALGKWSLVDCFVMVLFMVAFRFEVAPKDKNIVKDIFDEAGASASGTIWVRPNLAMQTFLAGTIASLVLGHCLSGCHRYALQIGEYGIAQVYGGGRQRLCNVLKHSGTWHGELSVWIPIVSLLVADVLLLIGVFQDTFQFEFLGLAGWALGDEDRIRPCSVFSLALAVPASNPQPDAFGIRWLQTLFVLFTLAMPLAYPALLLVLWAAPLANGVQRKLLVVCEIFDAWSGLDVFVLSIAASVLEIERFALFIVGSKCDPLDAAVAKTPLAAGIPGPVTCFDVKSTLRHGYFMLLAACLLSSIIGSMVLHRCSAALCAPTAVRALPAEA